MIYYKQKVNKLKLLRRVKKLFFGSYKVALEEGLIAEDHVSIVGGKLWQ